MLTLSKKLIVELRKISPKQIGKLMGISEKLSVGVYEYVADWKAKYDTSSAKQALLAFRGDVYLGLDADSFSGKDFDYAQQHLRILSGLYGVLRPLDLMQPYRLEMSTKLANEQGKDLYAFWDDRIARLLTKTMAEQGDDLLINLASNEYFKATQSKSLGCRIITPVFKDRKHGEYKTISFFAKKARGMMVRHIIRERIADPKGILAFRAAGYKYNRSLSNVAAPVFTRDKAP